MLIYHLQNATITSMGILPFEVILQNSVFTVGKAYVNGQDIPIMLRIDTDGYIYTLDMSGNAINASYVSGTIVAIKN